MREGKNKLLNSKNVLIGFVGIIALLLIFNYFYPVFSGGNTNLNENSEIAGLYQSTGISEEYKVCTVNQNQYCYQNCYEGCEVIKGKPTCVSPKCDLQCNECKNKKEYCPECLGYKTVYYCEPKETKESCNVGGNICNLGKCTEGKDSRCEPDPKCNGVKCTNDQYCIDGRCVAYT